jgi:hypothetical protein
MEYPRDTVKFCSIGYNDACINFRLQFSHHDFDILRKCIAGVSEYNNYRGTTVAKAFDRIKDQVYSASFGREGSPVLYLYIHPQEYNAQTETWNPRTPEVLAKIVKNIRKAFSSASVDEFMTMDEGHQDNPACVRLWWD